MYFISFNKKIPKKGTLFKEDSNLYNDLAIIIEYLMNKNGITCYHQFIEDKVSNDFHHTFVELYDGQRNILNIPVYIYKTKRKNLDKNNLLIDNKKIVFEEIFLIDYITNKDCEHFSLENFQEINNNSLLALEITTKQSNIIYSTFLNLNNLKSDKERNLTIKRLIKIFPNYKFNIQVYYSLYYNLGYEDFLKILNNQFIPKKKSKRISLKRK